MDVSVGGDLIHGLAQPVSGLVFQSRLLGRSQDILADGADGLEGAGEGEGVHGNSQMIE